METFGKYACCKSGYLKLRKHSKRNVPKLLNLWIVDFLSFWFLQFEMLNILTFWWFMAHGSWLKAHKFLIFAIWNVEHFDIFMVHGAWRMAHGSRLMAHASRLVAHDRWKVCGEGPGPGGPHSKFFTGQAWAMSLEPRAMNHQPLIENNWWIIRWYIIPISYWAA